MVSLGPIELGLVKRAGDSGYPVPADVRAVASRLEVADRARAAAFGAVAKVGVPFVVFDGTGNDDSIALDEIALALAPPPPIERRVTDVVSAVQPILRNAVAAAETRLLVIGGGFTGLWAAIDAKSTHPHLDVVIVEGDAVAHFEVVVPRAFQVAAVEEHRPAVGRQDGAAQATAEELRDAPVHATHPFDR